MEFCLREEQGEPALFRDLSLCDVSLTSRLGAGLLEPETPAIGSYPCCTLEAKAVASACLPAQGQEAGPLAASPRWLWRHCPDQC